MHKSYRGNALLMKIKCRTEAKKLHDVYDKYSGSAMQFRVGIQHSLESTVETGDGYFLANNQ
jgi:hypothetical protein